LDTDVLIDIQRGYAPALVWFTSITDLPFVPGLVVMELIQDAQNMQQVRRASSAACRTSAYCLANRS
jgi:predicted nucleic acid-binding protein